MARGSLFGYGLTTRTYGKQAGGRRAASVPLIPLIHPRPAPRVELRGVGRLVPHQPIEAAPSPYPVAGGVPYHRSTRTAEQRRQDKAGNPRHGPVITTSKQAGWPRPRPAPRLVSIVSGGRGVISHAWHGGGSHGPVFGMASSSGQRLPWPRHRHDGQASRAAARLVRPLRPPPRLIASRPPRLAPRVGRRGDLIPSRHAPRFYRVGRRGGYACAVSSSSLVFAFHEEGGGCFVPVPSSRFCSIVDRSFNRSYRRCSGWLRCCRRWKPPPW